NQRARPPCRAHGTGGARWRPTDSAAATAGIAIDAASPRWTRRSSDRSRRRVARRAGPVRRQLRRLLEQADVAERELARLELARLERASERWPARSWRLQPLTGGPSHSGSLEPAARDVRGHSIRRG